MNARVMLAVLVSAMTACSSEDGGGVVDAKRASITYYADVKPILERHCVACHATAEVERKVVLTSYAGAFAVHDLIYHAVAERKMPPYGADNGGACGTWKDARWLRDEEIQVLRAWSTLGAPAGNAATERPLTEPYPSSLHVEPATRVSSGDFVPRYDHGVVRCFVVDPGLVADRFLTALQVRSNRGPWSVQQATLYSLDSAEAEAAATARDSQDSEPGYDCVAGPLVAPTSLLVGWTWGMSTLRLPEGTGLRVRANRKLVLQLHYNTILSTPQPDRTEMALELVEGGVREATMLRVGGGAIAPKPTDPLGTEFTEVELLGIGEARDMLGAYPRMRLFGKSLRLEKVVAGVPNCLLSMTSWDYHGKQRLFVSEEARSIAAGDTLRVTCTYAGAGRERPLASGDADDDEECSAYLYVVPR